MDGFELSDLIREGLSMQDLYVFNNSPKPKVIEKIIVEYHRLTKFKPREAPEEAQCEYAIFNCTERLVIDRETETLEHIQNIGTRHKVTHKYEIDGGIKNLLDMFNGDDLFNNLVGNPDDVIETPNETKYYKIIVDYKNETQKIVIGTFDKNGLPDDFGKFADTVFEFMRFYGSTEIFNPLVYDKAKRRESEYIFCSVAFEGGGKSYYYLTKDDSIEINDLVIVPAGKDNHEAIVRVVDIEYFSDDNAPYPVKKTKWITKKYTDEDLVE